MDPEPVRTDLPPLFRRHVRRPRLTRLIDESRAQSVVVMGPAGYGKTTLAREWAQGRNDVVWYQSTSASADVAAFSVGIADAVLPFVPEAGDRLRQRIRVPEAPEKAARPYAELLSHDLTAWPAGAWLIVDDYHLVTESSAVEEFVDWLLTLSPSLRLLVTTRQRPAWLSAKRILHGEVTEIDKDHLAMTSEEAGQILTGRTTEAVRALVRQAEGWPVLIGLASLAAASEFPSDRISEALFRYFAEEVFRREPPEVQEFMLLASIPAAISARLARDVLGIEKPEAFLARLEADGLIRKSESAGSTFHPLLRSFLQQKVLTEHPETAATVLAKALEDARSAERWDEAFDLAIRTQPRDLAAEIAGQGADDLLAEGRIETIEAWLELCGSAAFDHPSSVLARAEVILRRGQFSEAAAVAQDLAAQLPSSDPRRSRAWYLAGHAHYLLTQERRALEFYELARETASSRAALKDALWGLLLTSTELGLVSARDYLVELDELAAGTIDDRLRIATGRITLACHSGSLEGIWSQVEPLLHQAGYARDPMVRSSFLVQAAYAAVARGDYPRALQLSSDAVDYCRDLGLSFAAGFCLIHQAAAQIGLRQFEHARDSLDRLSDLATASDNPFLRGERGMLELKYLISSEGASAAHRNPPRHLHDEVPPVVLGELLGLEAISRASTGDARAAQDLIARATVASEAVEARYYAAFAELIVQLVQGNKAFDPVADSASLLRQASADEFIDAFVIAYRGYPPLLQHCLGDPGSVSLVRRIVRLANDAALARSAGLVVSDDYPTRSRSLTVLTPREGEVLQLMSEGLSNEEISKRLFLSVSTTKVHVRHILRKLGVRTRLQAVLHLRDSTNNTART
jgi:LuxR family maltose regulon positive regulatory protein